MPILSCTCTWLAGGEVVFDRVLDRADVQLVAVHAAQRRVERRRLTRAGRAGDQQDAVRLVDLVLPDRQRVLAEAQVLQRRR